ncbi:class E sortase [Streptomyces sp. NA02950]|uniref:class E sortase n=1 Tax=Streptomyces sp. NA02950 TaxID=2742137 RepID=UPI0020CAB9C2|nr:class E sortase [Streptomyces sp. NA02950]
MTALRPEREGAAYGAREAAPYASYEPQGPYDAHGGSDAFAASVERPDDPLNDPLPGAAPDGATGHTLGTAAVPGRPPDPAPRRRHRRPPAEESAPEGAPDPTRTPPPGAVPPPTGRRRRRPAATEPGEAGETPGPPTGRRRARAAPSEPGRADEIAVLPPVTAPAPSVKPAAPPRSDDETVALRTVAPRAEPSGSDQTMPLRKVGSGTTAAPGTRAEPTPPGGRAARRRAAQEAARRGGRRGGAGGGTGATAPSGAAPRTRMEAKRAARARKDSPGVVMSRVVGELFITLGVVMLLFVTYQLWWTNIRAHQQANGAANNLRKQWDENGDGDRDPGAFSPGQGFAIIYIPKLDVKAPIAEGIDKHTVLDRGMVGHYAKGKLKTAMPWDKKGNFALAGHRNTHGEPFRYINHLKRGDEIIIETQRRYYTYEMDGILPQTSPGNTGVIGPVPAGSGFTKPGRYITLTTCTPEFTSTYRMIVWGKMVDERPRSRGKPNALVE